MTPRPTRPTRPPTVSSSENVDVIIGAASSGVTLSVIDKITAAGVTMFSPANTSEALSTYADKGLYFRTAPPDLYQGDVLGQFVVNDGNQTVCDPQPRTTPTATASPRPSAATITAAGVRGRVPAVYDPTATIVRQRGRRDRGRRPGRDHAHRLRRVVQILRTMVEKGIGPKVKAVYGCDGNIGNALGDDFDAGK